MLGTVGTIVGSAGILVCLLTGVVRIAGSWHFAGLETRTVFLAGIALMVAGCLGKLHQLVDR